MTNRRTEIRKSFFVEKKRSLNETYDFDILVAYSILSPKQICNINLQWSSFTNMMPHICLQRSNSVIRIFLSFTQRTIKIQFISLITPACLQNFYVCIIVLSSICCDSYGQNCSCLISYQQK